MAQQIINNGSADNDGTGEGLRSGAQKINENFTELYTDVGINNLKVSADVSIATHNNVDLTDLKQNYVLKYDGTNFIPCMKSILRDSSLSINTTSSQQIKITQNVDFLRTTSQYRITINYAFSYDVGNTDIITFFRVDNNGIANIANQESLRYEPKDSAGNDGDGRGTNQKLTASHEYYYQPTTAGSKLVEFAFQSGVDGVESAIWDLSIVIEEELI